MKFVTRSFVVAFILLFTILGCSKPRSTAKPDATQIQQCDAAVENALGKSAVALRCGDLTGGGKLEVLGVVPLKDGSSRTKETLVSRAAVLRLEASGTVNELDVEKNFFRNPVGYVGIDFIDDSPSYGFQLEADPLSDSIPTFTLSLTFLNDKLQPEGVPVDITWNPKAQRFQEYVTNQDPEGFRPEIQNPPHLNTPRR